MKKHSVINASAILVLCSAMVMSLVTSCEGPQGIAGQDANESCIQCHKSDGVQAKSIEYTHSLHFEGEAYEEGTRTNCAPCHSHQGFTYVVKNNTPATFTVNPADATKYINNYIADATSLALPGAISCFTCHSSLHTTYTEADILPLTTTAPVAMTMYGGSKTINFAQASSNLCAKCHQPRPVTASSGNVIDYSKLVSEPTANYTLSSIGYRTGVHYGTHGAIAAGVGGIEFGTGYTNSVHTTTASCASCHMATPTGLSGGHSFNSAGNFAGCNTCHTTMSATNATLVAAQADIEGLLEELAAKINEAGGGNDILLKEDDGMYHGYFNIFDANANPGGYYKNPANGTPAFPVLTNAQFGAVINYQLVYRDASLGVHNYPYTKKLLENSLAAL